MGGQLVPRPGAGETRDGQRGEVSRRGGNGRNLLGKEDTYAVCLRGYAGPLLPGDFQGEVRHRAAELPALRSPTLPASYSGSNQASRALNSPPQASGFLGRVGRQAWWPGRRKQG